MASCSIARFSTCRNTSRLRSATRPSVQEYSFSQCSSARRSRASLLYAFLSSPVLEVCRQLTLCRAHRAKSSLGPGSIGWVVRPDAHVARAYSPRRSGQTIIYVGFAVYAVGCGCLSIVRPGISEGLLVFFMILTGTGAGGVRPLPSSEIAKACANSYCGVLQTLQTTTIAAQASVPRRDMSVVTAVRNVSTSPGL